MYNIHILFTERDSNMFLCFKEKEFNDDFVDIYNVEPYKKNLYPHGQQDFCSDCYGYYFMNFIFATNE